MKLRKMIAILLAAVMLLCMLSACGSKGNDTGNANNNSNTNTPANSSSDNQGTDRTEPYRLGVMNSSGATVFEATSQALRSLCEAAGVELVTAESAGYDDQGMLTTYENLVAMGVDGVVCASFSEGPIRLLADLFEENDVDWFLANRQISDPDLKEYVFGKSNFVGNDHCNETDIAYEVVERLHKDYGVKNLAVIGLTQGDLNGDLRDKGITKACEDLGINFLTETRGVKDVTDITNAVEGIISSYPEMDGIFIVGGLVTNGALAGANQALVNHNMQDKVYIGMIDIAAGMEEFMGEGKPLKVVAGGNLVIDQVLAAVSMINHFNGVNADQTPYVINTRMMFITSPEDSVDYAEYYENPTRAMMNGDQWYDTLLGKSLDAMQSFVDNFTIAYAKSLNQ